MTIAGAGRPVWEIEEHLVWDAKFTDGVMVRLAPRSE